jgi:starch phosphorylase
MAALFVREDSLDRSALRETLHWLAANLRWTWSPRCRELLFSLPGAGITRHPVQTVGGLDEGQLDRLLSDDGFMSSLREQIDDLDRVLAEPAPPQIAYASPEFGIDALVPQYSGGLGVLAGDHLKAASDLALPLVGVGLFYRHGYFTQRIEDGRQTEEYPDVTPDGIGAVDTGLVVSVPYPGREVIAGVWRLDVGRIPLLLLDTNLDANSEADRAICDCLYGGDRQHRLDQEMLLGVGGSRAVTAHGWEVPVHHLNEGHAGFIVLDMVDRVIADHDLPAAIERIRPGLVFTTHTPVPAGIDRFHRDLIAPYLGIWAERWGVPAGDLWALGEDPDDEHQFNMAALTLRLSSAANGVSRLHGEVSRDLFAGVGIGDQIGAVTNGVHARTWAVPEFQTVFDAVLGPGWSDGDPAAWDRVGGIDDQRLAGLRRGASRSLSDLVARAVGHRLDPDALIVGFARRFAPYKRATLLLQDRDRLRRLLENDDRPVHFVFAGKAHPLDDMGKALVADIVEFSGSEAARHRLSFLPGYDMEIAATLVAGCDVWLNNPIRPREASGTSGEKAVLNGGLNCSILDGWWAEMYDGANGWAITASDDPDPEVRDREEAASLLDNLEAIVEEYHGHHPAFLHRIRHAWSTLGPRVTAARMLRDYQANVYDPALRRSRD